MGKKSFRVVLGAVLACSALLAPAGAQAYVINVTTTADEFDTSGTGAGCSLREAVQVANDNTATDPFSFGGCNMIGNDPSFPLDVIQLPAPSYTLTRDGVDDNNNSGDLDILNEGVSLLGQASSGPTTIAGDADGSGDDRVIEVHGSAANQAGQDFGATGLVITGGRATGFGGGIYLNGPANSGQIFVADIGLTTLTNNTATSSGGAVESDSVEDLGITQSTISGNSTRESGGGVDTSDATVGAHAASTAFENVTVTNNTADSENNGAGSGGGISAQLATATATLYNTILGGNFDASSPGTVSPDCAEVSGAIDSNNNNLITVPCPGYDPGSNDVLGVAPGLAGLAPIPGAGLSTVLAHDLLPGSPARDTGSPVVYSSGIHPDQCFVFAQNFGPRPVDGNGDGTPVCDIGSVEADALPSGSGGGGGTGSTGAPLTAAPGPTGLRAAALKKCKKKKSATARKKCKRKARLLPL